MGELQHGALRLGNNLLWRSMPHRWFLVISRKVDYDTPEIDFIRCSPNNVTGPVARIQQFDGVSR